MKCEHKYVAMEDGTNDLLCVKCRKFAMQAVAWRCGATDATGMNDVELSVSHHVFEISTNHPLNIQEVAARVHKDIVRRAKAKGLV